MTQPSLAVQTFSDATNELPLNEVQPLVGLVDHEDVLVTPATLLQGLDVDRLRL